MRIVKIIEKKESVIQIINFCMYDAILKSAHALSNMYFTISHYLLQVGSGAIIVLLNQPYLTSSISLLLWDCDTRCYSYIVSVSKVSESLIKP